MSSKNRNLDKGSDVEVKSITKYKFAIVVADWNEDITYALRDGCIATLKKHGAKDENIIVSNVPGAYELPLGARISMSQGKIDAVICIGCVIQGETKHNDYINNAVAMGIMQLGLSTGKPVIFGLLTPNDHQQAADRAGGKYGNKGVEAAMTAIKMVHLANDCGDGKGRIGFS